MQEYEIGQPPKIDKPGLKERFLVALGKGASYQIACGYAGIAYQTLRRWMIKAEAIAEMHEEQLENHPDKKYYDFYCEVRRVESYAALKWLEKIDEAASVHWQAAAWKLERRFPEDYGRQERAQNPDSAEDAVKRAKDEVLRLAGDNNGRSPSAEG